MVGLRTKGGTYEVIRLKLRYHTWSQREVTATSCKWWMWARSVAVTKLKLMALESKGAVPSKRHTSAAGAKRLL